MTRRLRPPAPLQVYCQPDGRPARLRRAGREHAVTHIAATWVRPASWWSTFGPDSPGAELSQAVNALDEERAYFRVVVNGREVQEIFRTSSGGWYLERIID